MKWLPDYTQSFDSTFDSSLSKRQWFSMVSHGMKIYICPAKQPDMDVYADGWKALKRTTNQKAVGSNPAGRAIRKQGLQRCLRSFLFLGKTNIFDFDSSFDSSCKKMV